MTQVRIPVQSAAMQDCVNVWYHPLVFHPPVTLIGTFEHTIVWCTWTRDRGKRCSRKCHRLTGLMLIQKALSLLNVLWASDDVPFAGTRVEP